ncbi:Stp1/IreP family PP2C-type Ser/Thr phosphatase [Aphanothece hegewaldii CCALA 016]|uniref:Stp1/IreP family PP2C-type Ser/Thr phosphatase n=1 Tax=Aphanothece hegewaldii CCALA 016 TaxID=2107694 RepID=A0A2T1M1Y7_9CHRO|nr:Stp1/IreP family PP2C-type Ser/Thr phosphatase [Aphanothece hegewaldii]PSF38717.1 Stp1/IreP family PP2C-type Ser/Thr phosphatase [Aphanothece hegewaldii CCALA 016]
MISRNCAGHSDPGVVRSVNQDSYYIDSQGRFYIVADGMGGHAGGQEASLMATQTIQAYLEEYWDSDSPSDELLEDALYRANQVILDDQYNHPERADMGTTVVVVLFRENNSWYTHIGDSRLYRLRSNNLEQLSEDHTWVARALKMGDISPEQAKTHPWRHVLFQCLGRRDLRQVEVFPLNVQPGDRLMMCSDGLTEEVPDEKIAMMLKRESKEDEIVNDLIEAAKMAGGSDNITVVLIAQQQLNTIIDPQPQLGLKDS